MTSGPETLPDGHDATDGTDAGEPIADTVDRVFFELRKVIVGAVAAARAAARRPVSPAATASSSRCRGSPRRSRPRRSRTSSGGRLPASSSRLTCCRPTSSGRGIYRGSTERFDVELGPVFVNFLLTDEINRAPAKVQSALLEVMAEQQVSIGGVTHLVPQPFLVVATQNPIESEGVYQLPDAQRNRFMVKILIDYPSAAEERDPRPDVGSSADRIAGDHVSSG